MYAIRWIEKICKCLICILVAAMASVVVLQVFTRYVLKVPLFWTEELGRYLMIWAGMIGAALGINYGIHASIQLIVNLFPKRVQAAFGASVSFLIVLFALLGIWASLNLIQFLKFQISPAMRISMVYPYLAIPAGCGILIVLIFPQFVSSVKSAFQKSP